MRTLLGTALATLALAAAPARAAVYFVTVAGLGHEPDYEERFTSLANDLDKLLKGSSGEIKVTTLTGKDATRDRFTQTLADIAKQAQPDDALVITMIGHGTFDGFEYKFNLVGPDISGIELAALCDRINTKRQLIVDTTSASGGAIASLQKPGRALITATKSGTEKNATVFARYWVEAFRDPAADADKNQIISALEAFQFAERKTADFYTTQKRLATEHPMIEDTGKGDPVKDPDPTNGKGLLASSFSLIRFGAAQTAAADPAKRDLYSRKEELEQQVDLLRFEKAGMPADEYNSKLKAIMLELARIDLELEK